MEKVNLKPINKIIVKRKDAETKTTSGLYIPETGAQKPSEGLVIRVPSVGKWSVKAGDAVLFNKYSPVVASVKDQEYLFLEEDDILAIIE